MQKLVLHPDVKAKVNSKMNDEIKDHFLNPRNLLRDEKYLEIMKPNGIGIIGSAGCGDSMNMWLKIENEKIKECKWFTSGCGSAVSSSSILSEMLVEMELDKAMQLTTENILTKLGEVSAKKVHCSILCIKALREAINDYYKKTKQYDKVIIEGARVVDNKTKTTDKEIEEAVLNGALNIENVEEMLKINFENKSEIEELIKFYVDKYKE